MFRDPKEIILTLAALVAVIGGVAGGLTFFATKAELSELRCEAFAEVELANLNTEILNASETIFNAQVTKSHLSDTNRSKNELIKVEEIIEKAKADRDTARSRVRDLRAKIDSRECQA